MSRNMIGKNIYEGGEKFTYQLALPDICNEDVQGSNVHSPLKLLNYPNNNNKSNGLQPT